jgi:acetoin utilization protein AcuB
LITSLINTNIPPLKESDLVSKALSWMDEFKVSHLPVIDAQGKLIGNISESELIDSNTPDKPLDSLKILLDRSYVMSHLHYLDALKIFSKSNLTVLPVMDKNEVFEGVITAHTVLRSLQNLSLVKEKGAIVSIFLHEKDYTMTQISNIVESSDAKILGSYVLSSPETTEIEVVLRLNRYEIRDVLQTFERYNYKVKALLDDKGYDDDIQDRYNHFMNYLNI